MLYPFAVTLLSINKFLCVCVSVRNSDIAGLSVVNKRCNLHVRENRITALSPTLLAIYLSLLYHICIKNKPNLAMRLGFLLLAKTSPGGAVFSADHITIVPAIRFVMDPDITAIVIITIIADVFAGAIRCHDPGGRVRSVADIDREAW